MMVDSIWTSELLPQLPDPGRQTADGFYKALTSWSGDLKMREFERFIVGEVELS